MVEKLFFFLIFNRWRGEEKKNGAYEYFLRKFKSFGQKFGLGRGEIFKFRLVREVKKFEDKKL